MKHVGPLAVTAAAATLICVLSTWLVPHFRNNRLIGRQGNCPAAACQSAAAACSPAVGDASPADEVPSRDVPTVAPPRHTETRAATTVPEMHMSGQTILVQVQVEETETAGH